jgi:nucleotide-binding universal stress UspA family protein
LVLNRKFVINMKLKRILVPLGGGIADEEALVLAFEMAKKSKADVYAMYVIEVNRNLPVDAMINSDVEKAENILSHAEDIASLHHYHVETDLIQSREVGAAIVDEAKEKKADLIIMGLNYKKRFGLFSLGNAIPYVLEEAPCRVILLREFESAKEQI